ncbi:hypothetical protein ROZALSC1DRAFT_31596, partial [Rozella allomycis CSF55]
MAISDCGGHPRSIEYAIEAFHELQATEPNAPNSICYNDLHSGLVGRLAKTYTSLNDNGLSTHVITPIIRRETFSFDAVVPGLEMRFEDAVFPKIFFCPPSLCKKHFKKPTNIDFPQTNFEN